MIIKTLLQFGVILVCVHIYLVRLFLLDLSQSLICRSDQTSPFPPPHSSPLDSYAMSYNSASFALQELRYEKKSDNYHHHAEKLTTYLRGLRTFNLLLLCASYFPLLWWVCVSEHTELHKQSSCILKINLLKITSCRLIATQFWRTKVALSFMLQVAYRF